jgi:hypothetical protein
MRMDRLQTGVAERQAEPARADESHGGVRPRFRPPGVDDAARVAALRAMRSTPSTAGGVERRTPSLRMSPLSCRRTGPKYPTPTPAEHLSDWSSA